MADLTKLFDACFRIQREACEAAGRHIPMVVENVKGATPWVGRARWNFGSFYLWGDVPALMPPTVAIKKPGHNWSRFAQSGEKSPQWNEGSGTKMGGTWWHDTSNNIVRRCGSKSAARKAASAMIAKIPEPLSRHIARVYLP